MTLRTVTYPTSEYVLVPVALTQSMNGVLEFGRAQPTHNTYLNLLGAVPGTLPGVIEHSGESVAEVRNGCVHWIVADWPDCTKLFTHPAPAQPVERQELSDEEIISTVSPYFYKGDGGYLCDMSPENVISGIRAIIAADRGQA